MWSHRGIHGSCQCNRGASRAQQRRPALFELQVLFPYDGRQFTSLPREIKMLELEIIWVPKDAMGSGTIQKGCV